MESESMTELKRTYIYHFIALVISLLLAIITINYLLLKDISLLPEHRDVRSPPLSYFLNYYFYTWLDFGSQASYEGIARVWRSFLLLFSPSEAVHIRLILLSYYFVMFFIPYISFFYLFKDFLKCDKQVSFLTALVVALMYSFNPYVIQNFSPPHFYVFSYALIPALVTSLILVLENDKFSLKILLAIIVTLMITSIIRYIIHVFILMAVITLSHFIYAGRGKEYSFKLFAKKYFLIAILVLLINLYWIAPALVAGRSKTIKPPHYIVTYEFTKTVSISYAVKDIFALRASWWPTLRLKPPPFLMNAVWIFLLYFIPLLSFVSLILWNSLEKKEKFLVLSGAFIYIIGFSLWKGLDNPIDFLSNFYSFLLFSTHSSIRWMFRVPGYFGTLVVFATSLLLGILVATVLRKLNGKRFYGKYLRAGLIIAIVLTSGVVGWQRFTGDLDGVLREGYYPEDIAHYERAPYSKAVILLSDYKGSFKPYHTGKPYIKLPNDLNKYLEVALKNGDEKTIKYLLSIVGADAFITNLKIENSRFFYLYPESREGVNIYISYTKHDNIYIQNRVGFMNDFSSDIYGSLSILHPSLIIITTDNRNNINVSDIIINPNKFVSTILSRSSQIIKPFDATVHHNPSKLWSKASTSDPAHGEWHIYLERFGIENWQSDYGYGLVFTWANLVLPESINFKDQDIIRSWAFEKERDLNEWRNSTPRVQFRALQELLLENGALKVVLWNSTWGWKLVCSPRIRVSYPSAYRFVLRVKGEHAYKVHVKVAEFDANGKWLAGVYLGGVGSGSFGWKTVSFDYITQSENVSYIQLQIWHGHETPEPLPNVIWIDYVKIYNLTKYARPVTLEMPFNIRETGYYRLFIRYFKNQRGGAIKVYLDSYPMEITTKDQLNKFIWSDLGFFI